jgi:hypothetical protein
VQAHLGVAGHRGGGVLGSIDGRCGLDPITEPPPTLAGLGTGGDARAERGLAQQGEQRLVARECTLVAVCAGLE